MGGGKYDATIFQLSTGIKPKGLLVAKISTIWMRTECRGFFSYKVLENPLRIGQSEALTVFESFIVVEIFYFY